jgi:hypothetical protein
MIVIEASVPTSLMSPSPGMYRIFRPISVARPMASSSA